MKKNVILGLILLWTCGAQAQVMDLMSGDLTMPSEVQNEKNTGHQIHNLCLSTACP